MSTGLFDKVKQLFTEVQAANPPAPTTTEPITLAGSTAKLSDGTEVSYDKLEVGGVMTAGGAPCVAGDYTLEDGTTVSVGDGGVITAVQPKEEMATDPEQPQPQPETAPVPQFNTQEFETRLVGYENRIAALEAALVTAKSENEKVQSAYAKQTELIGAMIELTNELIGKPSTEPPVQIKKTFSFSKVETKSKGLDKYTKAAKQIAEQSA